MQVAVIAALAVLSLEMVDFGESYKAVRPYKYYNRHPWRPPRWHPPMKSPKHYHSKRGPPHKYHAYVADDHRYAPHYEDSVEESEDDKPYIIVIELPRRKEKRKKRPYQRVHVVEPSKREREIDYIDDDNDDGHDDGHDDGYGDGYDDGELKVYRLDDNKIQIKVNKRSSELTT